MKPFCYSGEFQERCNGRAGLLSFSLAALARMRRQPNHVLLAREGSLTCSPSFRDANGYNLYALQTRDNQPEYQCLLRPEHKRRP
jgi:hypothetical protein